MCLSSPGTPSVRARFAGCQLSLPRRTQSPPVCGGRMLAFDRLWLWRKGSGS
jgi:hypothetical protein